MSDKVASGRIGGYFLSYTSGIWGLAQHVYPGRIPDPRHIVFSWGNGFFVEAKDNTIVNHNTPPMEGFMRLRTNAHALIFEVKNGTVRIPSQPEPLVVVES